MRLLIFYLVLLVAQGFLGTLLNPLPAPDLFLLGVMTFFWRLNPWQLVLLGYGVGLFQDVVGHGALGIHALGLAGAMLVAGFVKSQFTTQDGWLERFVLLFAAFVGKWLVMAGLFAWLSGVAPLWLELARIASLEFVFTMLLAGLILPWAESLRKRGRLFRRRLI